MVFDNHEQVKNLVYLAEKIRDPFNLPHFSIYLMQIYAGAQARLEVTRHGDVFDFQTAAGAGRIAIVSANRLLDITSPKTQGILQSNLLTPINRWESQPKTLAILQKNPKTIHGGDIDWPTAFNQDKLATRIRDKKIDLGAIITNALATLKPDYLETNAPQLDNPGEASEAGVMMVRIAREIRNRDVIRSLDLMTRGVQLVRRAHQSSPNPDRMRVILTWKYKYEVAIGRQKEASSTLEELQSLGVSKLKIWFKENYDIAADRVNSVFVNRMSVTLLTGPYNSY
ncbi:hypothetical protein A2872_04115 [Candidatus Gottesmanbacteria bacterium RIFCSPHIGHO2_01_FULL_42_12]|uniref:Uncharacterized protein n=1 Tax=Candidatus Gottesmanbacteria bacterium RIFCSPHIGHO2_01_FULL_42_12 TaxID=1798377 RepID=A0A1F5Z0Z8_9BACT|nr:MAG: hypothetical protein A2872_04115 [Candidatus Gottesmanbacteria bacterium RIFCSPHIGHO2_01_FULL_42_12]